MQSSNPRIAPGKCDLTWKIDSSLVRFFRKVSSTRNWRVCMNVNEARGACNANDRSRWRSVVSAYAHGKKA